jgi:hypothetical protein
MTIDDCMKCVNHVLYQNGYVICNFFKTREQRVTGTKEDGIIYIVHCPKEEGQ